MHFEAEQHITGNKIRAHRWLHCPSLTFSFLSFLCLQSAAPRSTALYIYIDRYIYIYFPIQFTVVCLRELNQCRDSFMWGVDDDDSSNMRTFKSFRASGLMGYPSIPPMTRVSYLMQEDGSLDARNRTWWRTSPHSSTTWLNAQQSHCSTDCVQIMFWHFLVARGDQVSCGGDSDGTQDVSRRLGTLGRPLWTFLFISATAF